MRINEKRKQGEITWPHRWFSKQAVSLLGTKPACLALSRCSVNGFFISPASSTRLGLHFSTTEPSKSGLVSNPFGRTYAFLGLPNPSFPSPAVSDVRNTQPCVYRRLFPAGLAANVSSRNGQLLNKIWARKSQDEGQRRLQRPELPLSPPAAPTSPGGKSIRMESGLPVQCSVCIHVHGHIPARMHGCACMYTHVPSAFRGRCRSYYVKWGFSHRDFPYALQPDLRHTAA